jgi:hypothetical protein
LTDAQRGPPSARWRSATADAVTSAMRGTGPAMRIRARSPSRWSSPAWPAQGFVEQEHSRFGGQRPGQGDPVRLAAGELSRAALSHFGESDPRQPFDCLGAGLNFGRPGGAQPKGDVLQGGEVGEETVLLEHHGDAAMFGGAWNRGANGQSRYRTGLWSLLLAPGALPQRRGPHHERPRAHPRAPTTENPASHRLRTSNEDMI